MNAAPVLRPATLRAVVEQAHGPSAFDCRLREFLDHFYGAGRGERLTALREEPPLLSPVQDAYLAAVAEHLALRFRLPVPGWAEADVRFLAQPFFAGGLDGLKALLLVESPLAFRRRLIFVSHDALSRPRDVGAKEIPSSDL